jgi:inorganic pyrophosphatase
MTFPKPFFRWRPHPWHGLELGPHPPDVVHAFIEITPFDLIKYEVDKATGYLRVDRPQRSSSLPPTLYGFVPRTYCGSRVGALSSVVKKGDGDPLDICVLSERPISRAEVILNARVVGGIHMIDPVLQNDTVWGEARDISDIPEIAIERLRHYFATYKLIPGKESEVSVERIYNCQHARSVVQAAHEDYEEMFGPA